MKQLVNNMTSRRWLMVAVLTALFACRFSVFTASAQSQFGYMSYDAVLQSMPEYVQMKADMAQLREKYEAEQKRVEADFNKKYEEFLDGQTSYPKTILQKRQSELQEMLDKNIAVKKESLLQLQKAETEALAPLKSRVAEAMMKVGIARNLTFIINTDINAVCWFNLTQGDDVTEAVKAMLNNNAQQ